MDRLPMRAAAVCRSTVVNIIKLDPLMFFMLTEKNITFYDLGPNIQQYGFKGTVSSNCQQLRDCFISI